VRLLEHRHNFKEVLPEKLKLAQNAYEDGHKAIRKEAKILEIESPISHPSLYISPIMIPLISNDITISNETTYRF
jgi:hypothetical protein